MPDVPYVLCCTATGMASDIAVFTAFVLGRAVLAVVIVAVAAMPLLAVLHRAGSRQEDSP